MIGRLRGNILEKKPPFLLLDVNGVGYEIEAPMSTFFNLSEIGSEVVLKTHLLVREDAQLLYGFFTDIEKTMFRELIKVSGIGAKVALAILSGMQVDEFINYVNNKDVIALTRIPGIGKKTAERLIIEIKDKLKNLDLGMTSVIDNGSNSVSTPSSQIIADASNALLALGYKHNDAESMVKTAFSTELTTEEIIRQALRATTNK